MKALFSTSSTISLLDLVIGESGQARERNGNPCVARALLAQAPERRKRQVLAANELTGARDFVEQGRARLVCTRSVQIKDNANVGPFELDLRHMYRIPDDQQGLSIRSDLISRMTWGVADDGARKNSRDDFLSRWNGLPLARGFLGLARSLGSSE